jgi:hypothetical protein
VARHLYHTPVVDGVYQLDEGAWRDDCFAFVQALGVGARRGDIQGPAVPRERGPIGPSLLRSSLKTRLGIERRPALPAWLLSDEARMRLVGCHAQPVRPGGCQRGAAPRQGPRTTGPLSPEALADHLVPLHVRALEALLNRVSRALAKAGMVAAQVTGLVEAPALETPAPEAGGGQVTRKRRRTDTRGQGHEIEVTGSGGQRIVVIAARPKLPVAAAVVPIQAHDTRAWRALVPPACTHLAGHARRHQVVFDRGVGDGVELGWLQPPGSRLVVPATANLAATVEAQAPAAGGEGLPGGCRGQTVRQGQGKTAWTARLETAVVGITGLTTDDPSGTAEHGRHHHRREVPPHPITAVVVRQWPNRDDGPGGQPVLLTHATVEQPVPPFEDADDRRRLEHCGRKARQPPWRVTHPPQQTARAVRSHIRVTVLLFALATAYRLPGAHADTGHEPVGWQRWRRQLLEQTRAHVIVLAQDGYGIFPIAAYALLLGGKRKAVPPGIGTHQAMLATLGLAAPG